jgi:pyruvate,orthophosphate dikinase
MTTATAMKTDLTHFVADAATDDRAILGGKGAGLVTMTRAGLRVPPAFVLSTACCAEYLRDRRLPDALVADIDARLARLEAEAGRTFGAGPMPLLLSVRSGAPVSMPGMMDTVLNLGLSRDAAIALAELSGSVRFMADVLARFHAMYAEIVLDALDPPRSPVDDVFAELGDDPDAGAVYDAVWARLQRELEEAGDETVPDDPRQQLRGAIAAVFRSWNTRRAITYRDLHGIDHAMGTAVVVQTMVFGNRDENSGSGVVFSRNPVTGEPGLFGEYLAASQGEDVVAGIRTPDAVSALEDSQPHLYAELAGTVASLERAYGDVLDVEFTVESGILYFLQVRSAKRTAPAAVRIAADFLREGGPEAAGILDTVTLDHLRGVARPSFDEGEVAAAREAGALLVQGTGASPGHVSGILALTADRAEELSRAGASVILAREVTSPTDLHGMIAAAGVVTATVARALGKTCVVGCAAFAFEDGGTAIRVGDRVLREGDEISLDGDTGDVYAGVLPVTDRLVGNDDLDAVLSFCRQVAGVDLFVRTATVAEIERARQLGAAGVVVAAADALATSPDLPAVMAEIRGMGPTGAGSTSAAFRRLSDVLTTGFAPLFAAAEGLEFGVRAIDFLVDETSEVLQSSGIADERPELALPLGSPELVSAQLRGLRDARTAAGEHPPRVHLSVRNLSDVGEATVLARLAESVKGEVVAGAYIASPRGALQAGAIAEQLSPIWVELRLLQAAMFGIPPRLLLTREPFERYAADGLVAVNPRHEIDASVAPLLDAVSAAAAGGHGDRIGLRVTGPVSEKLLAGVHGRGVRRFAVDFAEAPPALLAFAKAALATRRHSRLGR